MSLVKFTSHRKESWEGNLRFTLSLRFFFFFNQGKCQRTDLLRDVLLSYMFLFSLIFTRITFIQFGYFWAEILKKAFFFFYHLYICLLRVWHTLAYCAAPCMSEFWHSDPKVAFLDGDCLIFLDKTESKKQILLLKYEINKTYLTFAK